MWYINKPLLICIGHHQERQRSLKYKEGMGNNKIALPTLFLTEGNRAVLLEFYGLRRIQHWGLER